MTTALQYRPEIDGLRAVAVLPVILFHAGFSVFSGGFVGVDVFFVISGYLITTIILREQAEGRFSILAFYERRARRILPALFVVIAACLPLAWIFMFPEALAEFGKSMAATSLFSSNILFWRERGYFETAAELKPLLHTWSLAVEEQYYIFFPIAVMLLWRFGVRALFGLILVAALASFVLSDWASTRLLSANFFLLPTRAWELLAGSLVAIWLSRRPGLTAWRGELGGAVGLALIAAAIFWVDETTPFPGRATLLPVVGTVLLILCAGPATLVGRFLVLRPLVWVGLISYSAYLWHQPLFAFARLGSPNNPGASLMLALAALALFLAWLTWRFVETPFRDRSRVSRRTIFAISIAGSLTFVALGLGLHFSGGVAGRFDPTTRALIATGEEDGRGRQGCVPVKDMPVDGCVFNAEAPRRALLWGDSHGMAIAEGLARELASSGYGLEVLNSSGCPPIANVASSTRPHCAVDSEKALTYLKSETSPDVIVISARWALYFEGTRFDNTEGGIEQGGPAPLINTAGRGRQLGQADWLKIEFNDTLRRVRALDKTVVLVGNVPEAGWAVPRRLALRRIYGEDLTPPLSTPFAAFQMRNRRTHDAFVQFLGDPAVRLVEPAAILCASPPSRCRVEQDGQALYRDNNHLSQLGAALVVPEIVKAVIAASEAAPREQSGRAGRTR